MEFALPPTVVIVAVFAISATQPGSESQWLAAAVVFGLAAASASAFCYRRLSVQTFVPTQIEPSLWIAASSTLNPSVAAVPLLLAPALITVEDMALLGLDPNRAHALLQIDEIAFDARNLPLLVMRHSALTEDQVYVNEVR